MGTELDRRGVAAAIGAYSIWGLFPAFWPLLEPAVPVEVLAHRIMWTAVLMVVVISVTRGWSQLRALRPRGWVMVAAAGALITVNWGLYIYAVFAGHVVEAALGYFVSPLVSVLLGVVVLRERLRRVQWVAVGLGAAAVVVIAIEAGQLPWIALGLASSFGVYGLLKSMIPLSAGAGVTAESLVLAPFAIATVVAFEVSGAGTLTGHGVGHVLLLIVSGPVTAVPLMLYARRRAPGAALHHRRADVPQPDPAVPVGRARRRGGDARHPVDRVRPGVGGARRLHGGSPPRAPQLPEKLR